MGTKNRRQTVRQYPFRMPRGSTFARPAYNPYDQSKLTFCRTIVGMLLDRCSWLMMWGVQAHRCNFSDDLFQCSGGRRVSAAGASGGVHDLRALANHEIRLDRCILSQITDGVSNRHTGNPNALGNLRSGRDLCMKPCVTEALYPWAQSASDCPPAVS